MNVIVFIVLPNRMLTASEIHDRLGINPNTLRQWTHKGHIRPVPLGPRFNLYNPFQILAHIVKGQLA